MDDQDANPAARATVKPASQPLLQAIRGWLRHSLRKESSLKEALEALSA